MDYTPQKEVPDHLRHVERMIRDVLKTCNSPIIDTYLRGALFWLSECDEIAKNK